MNLTKIRKDANKSQKEISEYLKVARSTYNGYELEKSEPNIETLIKLADYYNVSVDYLIGREFKNEVGYLTEEEINFVKTFLLLNEQNKYKITGYLFGLLAQQDDK